MSAVVEIRDVSRAYRSGEWALRDVTLGISAGEVVGLIGRNGAGKTTLLRSILGMLRPQHGSISVFGLDVLAEPVAVRRRVGFLGAGQSYPGSLSVRELLVLHRALFPTWDPAVEAALLERFGLDPGRRLRTLSTGQYRQAAFVCAVAHHPELLILDEPEAGLDPAVRRQFLAAAVDVLIRDGSAVVFSSHNMTDVGRIASRVVIIDHGRTLLDHPVDELADRSTLAIVAVQHRPLLEPVLAVGDCVRAREREGQIRALFAAPLREVTARLNGIPTAGLGTLGLEDLFIELVGE